MKSLLFAAFLLLLPLVIKCESSTGTGVVGLMAPIGRSNRKLLDLAGAISNIADQIGGGGCEEQGNTGGSGVAGVVGNAVGGFVESLWDSLGLGGSTDENAGASTVVDAAGGSDQNTTIGSTIDSIVGAIGGPNSPLAGQNVTSFVPVLEAILQDPKAAPSLPGLLGGLIAGLPGDAGGLDVAALGPILSAVTSNTDALAALPSFLGLLPKLMGGFMGDGDVADVAAGVGDTLTGVSDQILNTLGLGGSGNSTQGITVGGLVDNIMAVIGKDNGPLAGQNVTGFVPVLTAILEDPTAAPAMPGLLGGLLGLLPSNGGGLDVASLGPVLNAVISSPDALAALPNVLGLLPGLMGTLSSLIGK